MAKAAKAKADLRRPRNRPAPDQDLRTLVTPEGVALHLRLADLGERAGALMIDLLIIGGVYIAATVAGIYMLASMGRAFAEPVIIVWFAAAFVLRNFYFVLFEMGARAATLGKRRMGIRVAARNGGRLTADAIFVRNAMRELELYLPLQALFMPGLDGWMKLAALVWCGVFVFMPMFNRDRLRAGDLLAGTWVVRIPKPKLLRDLTGGQEFQSIGFTPAQLDAYGIKELQVLEDVLRRFDRRSVALVAQRIRAKIGYPLGEESDGAFLNAYYAALRLRLETGALMGRRRADKFDKL